MLHAGGPRFEASMRDKTVPLRIELDESVDAAYVYLAGRIGPGEAVAQVMSRTIGLPERSSSTLISTAGVLGIEVLAAPDVLPVSLLQAMRRQ
jgi:hypothetical protein